MSKPTVSRWLLEAIRMAYASKGADLPGSLRAHSTRAQASSWVLVKGVSIREACDAANWSSPLTFADFYKLDVAAPSTACAVRGVADATLVLVRQHRLSLTNFLSFLRLTRLLFDVRVGRGPFGLWSLQSLSLCFGDCWVPGLGLADFGHGSV